MKRKDALVLLRVAGYHDDSATWTRLYIENRVSALDEWHRGRSMRTAGVPCVCIDCKRREP